MSSWLPQFVLSLQGYTKRKFFQDLIAGITVGLVSLPLAMAFAISSGVPPQAGIYTAVIAGFLISALGGSKQQIGGPTGAFVVVVAGILAKHGLEGLFLCTLMAGVILVILGATGLGSAIKFMPRPIIVGFTNGIALLIASTQLKDFFGIQAQNVPGAFLPRLVLLAEHFPTFSPLTTFTATAALALLIAFRRYLPQVPGSIVALFGGTLLAWGAHLPLETIGSRFGGIPSGLPTFAIPHFRWDLVQSLASPALTVAMLGAIESLMSAMVADRMGGGKHNPNVELIAQGIANMATPLFGGLPATGAIARTATNIRSGAQTPVAGIVHSFTLLLVLLVAAPLAQFIPLAVLAAILMMVSYNMGEWREIPRILRSSRFDIAIWAVTFALTVFADLTLAVEAGMILAAFSFIRKVAMTTTVREVTPQYIEEGWPHILQNKDYPAYVRVYRIHGPFLFGATDKLEEVIAHLSELPQIVILRLRNMTAIDATGLLMLEEFADQLHATGRQLILCGAREQPEALMHKANFQRHVGADNICPHVDAALKQAERLHEELYSGTTP